MASRTAGHAFDESSSSLLEIQGRKEVQSMKKFAIREVETLRTTQAFYGGCCCVIN